MIRPATTGPSGHALTKHDVLHLLQRCNPMAEFRQINASLCDLSGERC
jgi:hypothetical protein